ncbi:MAG: carboxypeptidase-like regulatory domain-containing protein [Candidatus Limnocylindria bacterium]
MSSAISRRMGPAACSVVLVLAFVLGACTTTPSPSSTVVPPASATACGRDEVAGGGINGTVVDADGNPLDDIFILIETSDGFRGTTRTGADGVFSAAGVAGEFRITTVDASYQQLVRSITVPCGELLDVELVLTPIGS